MGVEVLELIRLGRMGGAVLLEFFLGHVGRVEVGALWFFAGLFDEWLVAV